MQPMDANEVVAAAQATDDYQPQWGQWTRQLVIVGLLIAVVYGLILLAPVMKLLSITFLLSLVMFAPSRLIWRYWHIPYGLAVTLCYGLAFLLLAVTLVFLIPASVDEANSLRHDAEQRYNQLQDTLRRYTPDEGIVMVFGLRLDANPVIDPLRNLALGTDQAAASDTSLISGADLRQVVATTTGVLAAALSGIAISVSTSAMALFLSFLVLLDLPHLERAVLGSIPPAYQREWSLLMRQIGSVWKGFFRGQALISFIVAVLTWLQLTLMGVQNAAVVAVLVGVISLIPNLGAILALVPVAVISLLQGSSVLTGLSNGAFALLAVSVNLVITQIIYNVVAPKIIGDAVNLPVPVIVVGVFLGAALGGVLGAFLITPIIGTVRLIAVYLLKKIGRQDPFPGQVPAGAPATELRNAIQSGS
jgi:predicted PurR-regulated permease PerM